jgi:hypothetical protein
MLLFIGFFNQMIQTAVVYQQHRATATKCSDLLDTMLLNPGIPKIGEPSVFGLQDTEFTQYTLNSSSLMRLNSSTGTPIYYEKTGTMYSNVTVGFGNSLLMPINNSLCKVVNYSSALNLLRINGAYGFQLTLTPVVTFDIEAERSDDNVELRIDVRGVGFPLANAHVSCYFLPVSLSGDYPDFLPAQATEVSTNEAGNATVTFPLEEGYTYVFLASAQVGGLAGVGFYVPPSDNPRVIPFVDDLSAKSVVLAHSYDVPNTAGSGTLAYNATFVFWNEHFGLQTVAMADSTGTVTSGAGGNFSFVTIPSGNPGVLLVAYGNGAAGGVAVLPWGVGSLGFPVVFGGSTAGREWVATDMRQVIVNGVAYQAKLSLWSLQGVQVVG